MKRRGRLILARRAARRDHVLFTDFLNDAREFILSLLGLKRATPGDACICRHQRAMWVRPSGVCARLYVQRMRNQAERGRRHDACA